MGQQQHRIEKPKLPSPHHLSGRVGMVGLKSRHAFRCGTTPFALPCEACFEPHLLMCACRWASDAVSVELAFRRDMKQMLASLNVFAHVICTRCRVMPGFGCKISNTFLSRFTPHTSVRFTMSDKGCTKRFASE